MSEDQLAEVLSRVRMDRRGFVRRAVLGSAFAVPVVASFPMGTALAGGSPGCTTGNGSPGFYAERDLAALAEDVRGVGPGKSLADKVAAARQYVCACDFEDAIAVMRAFINEVRAQSGKKIDPAVANDLVHRAERIIEELQHGSSGT